MSTRFGSQDETHSNLLVCNTLFEPCVSLLEIWASSPLHPSNDLSEQARIPPLALLADPLMEPSFREPEENESTLNNVLDSLIPFLKDNEEAIKLPIFKGKAPLSPSSLAKTSTSNLKSKKARDFAWSRGLSIELSPLKTRSTRKKLAQSSIPLIETITPSSSETRPLRALKALASAK